MIYQLNTQLSKEEASKAFYYGQAYIREQNLKLYTPPAPDVYEKSVLDRIQLKRAKAQWKNMMIAHFGKDQWRKFNNVPFNMYSSVS